MNLGFARAQGRYVSVIDADMQHPPEHLPDMVALAESGVQVVIPSRYIAGGRADGLEHPSSQDSCRTLSRWMAMGLFRRRLQGITDPLSGYFLIERSVIASATLRPYGFKILF